MSKQPYLKIENINKQFPGVKALIDVSIDIYDSEILGLVGINGAGKSTLMNVLAGIYNADSGSISIGGNPVFISNPLQAEKNKIALIHQEAFSFRHLTVAENMYITRLNQFTKGLKLDYQALFKEAEKYLRVLDSSIDPKAIMDDITTGERQIVEIARALSMEAEIVLFDEATSSLTVTEKETLFGVIRRLKEQKKTIIYITHFLYEIMEICDKVVVMRDGKVVKNNMISDVELTDIVEQMIGHEVNETKFLSTTNKKEKVLEIKDLRRGKYVRDASFSLYEGEILGFWGLLGSGRTELIRAMLRLDKPDRGTIFMFDSGGNPKAVSGNYLLKQCGYITENRHDDGLFLRMPVYMNLSMATLKDFMSRFGLLISGKEKSITSEYVEKLSIKTPSVDTRAEQLSGGNQQKMILARWIYKKPKIFIVDEPTRGVDVNAKEEIHSMIFELARQGNSVILISSEVEEIMNMSSRVLVVNDGSIVAELEGNMITQDNLMAMCVSKKEAAQ